MFSDDDWDDFFRAHIANAAEDIVLLKPYETYFRQHADKIVHLHEQFIQLVGFGDYGPVILLKGIPKDQRHEFVAPNNSGTWYRRR